uniref:Cytochrome c oxidase assembly protein COX18, mitochondrial isoform X1 n=2 Tax=Pogona vitticeps TaxID=103695 RepID=A0A6J0VA63_9SAUR
MRIAVSKMAASTFAGSLAVASAVREWRAVSRFRLLCRGGGVRTLATPAPFQGGGGGGGAAAQPFWGGVESLASSAPVVFVESGIVALQAASGLPWWAALVATSAVLRTGLTLPLAVLQYRVLAKLENLQPEIQSLAKELHCEVSVYGKQLGWSEKEKRFQFKRNMRRIVSNLYIRDNCHPVKASLLVLVQMPMWVFVSIALRNLSIGRTASEGDFIQEQLSTGGVLWFTDLTVPDSTWIMPVTLGLLNLFIIELFALRKTEISKLQKYITHFCRAVSVLMIPIAATAPSCIALYWLSSSFMGLSHNLLLRSPAFRRLCAIPQTKSHSDTPYRDLISAFCAKLSIK